MRTYVQKQKQVAPNLAQANPPMRGTKQNILSLHSEESQTGVNSGKSRRFGHAFSQISIHPPNNRPTAHLQRKADDGQGGNTQVAQPDDAKKAELEFHSTVAFNSTFSGFNPSGPPKEGDLSFIRWSVWNTGWKTAPEHMNRLTIYHADRCSGCRDEQDEIFRLEMPAPSIVSITQPGQAEYENVFLVGMGLRAGLYDAYVDLDVQNQVDEINEDNNTAFMPFAVQPNPENESAPETDAQ